MHRTPRVCPGRKWLNRSEPVLTATKGTMMNSKTTIPGDMTLPRSQCHLIFCFFVTSRLFASGLLQSARSLKICHKQLQKNSSQPFPLSPVKVCIGRKPINAHDQIRVLVVFRWRSQIGNLSIHTNSDSQLCTSFWRSKKVFLTVFSSIQSHLPFEPEKIDKLYSSAFSNALTVFPLPIQLNFISPHRSRSGRHQTPTLRGLV